MLICAERVGAEEPADLEAQLAAFDQSIEQAKAAREAQVPAAHAARQRSKELADAVFQERQRLLKSQATLQELPPKRSPARDAYQKLVDERAKLEQELAAAQKTFADQRGKEGEAAAVAALLAIEQKLATQGAALGEAIQSLQKLDAALAEARQSTVAAQSQLKQAETAEAAFRPEREQAEVAFSQAEQAYVSRQKEREQLLFQWGRRISFAQHVAPVLMQRCVACHNARIAKGRFSLDGYASLLKGGESGPALEAGRPDTSHLIAVILDGSMPKDSPPLSTSERELLTRWIREGALLDAGVASSASLFSIMPRPVPPQAPATYRVPVPVRALAFSPDGSRLISSGYRELLQWNVESGALDRRMGDVAERAHDIEFSPDGQSFAVAAGVPGQWGEVKLFHWPDGTLRRDLVVTEDEQFACGYSPDGTRLATAGADRALRVFDLATNRRVLQIEDHADWILDLDWSPNGQRIVTGSRDKTAKVVRVEGGDSLTTFTGHNQPVTSVRFLPDSEQVVSGGREPKLRVWQVAEAKQVREIGGFGGDVLRLARGDDQNIFSTGVDRQVRHHNASNGQQTRVFAGHTEWTYGLAVHGPSQRIASGSHDGEVRLWNLATGELIRTFVAVPPTP